MTQCACGSIPRRNFFSTNGYPSWKTRYAAILPAPFVAHLAKYRSLMPSLAGLFELADLANEGGVNSEALISLGHAQQAAALCDYLESHARRVYACVISPECKAARELARHIQNGDLAQAFATRSVYLKGWAGLDTAERVRGALYLLEDAGWLRRAEFHRCQPGADRASCGK